MAHTSDPLDLELGAVVTASTSTAGAMGAVGGSSSGANTGGSSAHGTPHTPSGKKRVQIREAANRTHIIRTGPLVDGEFHDADGGPAHSGSLSQTDPDADDQLNDEDIGGNGDGDADGDGDTSAGPGGARAGARQWWVRNRVRVGAVLLLCLVVVLWYAQATGSGGSGVNAVGSECSAVKWAQVVWDSVTPAGALSAEPTHGPTHTQYLANITSAATTDGLDADGTGVQSADVALRFRFEPRTESGGVISAQNCVQRFEAECEPFPNATGVPDPQASGQAGLMVVPAALEPADASVGGYTATLRAVPPGYYECRLRLTADAADPVSLPTLIAAFWMRVNAAPQTAHAPGADADGAVPGPSDSGESDGAPAAHAGSTATASLGAQDS